MRPHSVYTLSSPCLHLAYIVSILCSTTKIGVDVTLHHTDSRSFPVCVGETGVCTKGDMSVLSTLVCLHICVYTLGVHLCVYTFVGLQHLCVYICVYTFVGLNLCVNLCGLRAASVTTANGSDASSMV